MTPKQNYHNCDIDQFLVDKFIYAFRSGLNEYLISHELSKIGVPTTPEIKLNIIYAKQILYN